MKTLNEVIKNTLQEVDRQNYISHDTRSLKEIIISTFDQFKPLNVNEPANFWNLGVVELYVDMNSINEIHDYADESIQTYNEWKSEFPDEDYAAEILKIHRWVRSNPEKTYNLISRKITPEKFELVRKKLEAAFS